MGFIYSQEPQIACCIHHPQSTEHPAGQQQALSGHTAREQIDTTNLRFCTAANGATTWEVLFEYSAGAEHNVYAQTVCWRPVEGKKP